MKTKTKKVSRKPIPTGQQRTKAEKKGSWKNEAKRLEALVKKNRRELKNCLEQSDQLKLMVLDYHNELVDFYNEVIKLDQLVNKLSVEGGTLGTRFNELRARIESGGQSQESSGTMRSPLNDPKVQRIHVARPLPGGTAKK